MLNGLGASLDTHTQVSRVQNFLVGYFSKNGNFLKSLDLGKNLKLKYSNIFNVNIFNI